MDYDVEYEKMMSRNHKFLEIFYNDLYEKGLTQKTLKKHLNNVSFYINDFLNYYEITDMKEGCYKIDEFLGSWFIKKAMWSNKTAIKENGASIKKFYKCMLDHKFIDEKSFNVLCRTIKEMMPQWIEKVEEYNHFEDF